MTAPGQLARPDFDALLEAVISIRCGEWGGGNAFTHKITYLIARHMLR